MEPSRPQRGTCALASENIDLRVPMFPQLLLEGKMQQSMRMVYLLAARLEILSPSLLKNQIHDTLNSFQNTNVHPVHKRM